MADKHPIYIWQYPDWPQFYYSESELIKPLAEVRLLQGKLIGTMKALGFNLQDETQLDVLTSEIVKSSEIEGDFLNAESVRSSIARHLGLPTNGLPTPDHHIEGLVQVMFDATTHCNEPLTSERLFGWHSTLFPNGFSGMYKITVANWRIGEEPMQVISGAMGKEHVHYEAPPSAQISDEMDTFIQWINEESEIDPVIKAGIAHLWFVSIHPFDDGNGRMVRTLTDMLLSRADGSTERFYSMSAQIRLQRNSYYEQLENAQHHGLDVTNWLLWFVDCLKGSIEQATAKVGKVLNKSRFWEQHRQVSMNDRQVKMVNLLWDGFEGKLNTSKWAKIAKCSVDTAQRDIQQLVQSGVLKVEDETAKRNITYVLVNA